MHCLTAFSSAFSGKTGGHPQQTHQSQGVSGGYLPLNVLFILSLWHPTFPSPHLTSTLLPSPPLSCPHLHSLALPSPPLPSPPLPSPPLSHPLPSPLLPSPPFPTLQHRNIVTFYDFWLGRDSEHQDRVSNGLVKESCDMHVITV